MPEIVSEESVRATLGALDTDELGPGQVSVDRAIRHARRTIRRRRIVTTVAATVLVAGVGIALVFTGGTSRRPAPSVVPTASAPTPSPTTPITVTSAPPIVGPPQHYPGGVSFLKNNEIITAHAGTIRLHPPAGATVLTAALTPSGIVFGTDEGLEGEVYLQVGAGPATPVSPGTFVVSAQGTRLAVLDKEAVTAYALPDLTKLATMSGLGVAGQSTLIGMSGNWVLIYNPYAVEADPKDAVVVWDVTDTTGYTSGGGAVPLAVTSDGRVLRRNVSGAQDCIGLSTFDDLPKVVGQCMTSPAGGMPSGSVSPDGQWIEMTFTGRSGTGYVISTANLAVNSLDQVATVPPGVPIYWSDNHVVLAGANEVAVCAEPRTAGVHPATCTHTPIPDGASVVGRYGVG